MNPYYSHQEYLKEELNKVPKNAICLEFGPGEGSSSVFSEFALKNPQSKIAAFDNKYEWHTSMSSKYKTENYSFSFVSDWNDYLSRKEFNDIYDLIFVDQSPWEARIQTIKRFKVRGKVFILHDYDFYNKGVYDKDIFSVGEGTFFYKHFNDDFVMEPHFGILPPTLVLRNKKSL